MIGENGICDFCGGRHPHRFCDRVRSVEFRADGHTIKRIELEPVRPQPPLDFAEEQAALQAAEGRPITIPEGVNARDFFEKLRAERAAEAEQERPDLKADALRQLENDAAAGDAMGKRIEAAFMSGQPAAPPLAIFAPEPVLPANPIVVPPAKKREPVLERAKAMAKALTEADEPMGVAKIARLMKCSEPTVYNVLREYGPEGCPSGPCFKKGPNGWYLTSEGGKVLL